MLIIIHELLLYCMRVCVQIVLKSAAVDVDMKPLLDAVISKAADASLDVALAALQSMCTTSQHAPMKISPQQLVDAAIEIGHRLELAQHSFRGRYVAILQRCTGLQPAVVAGKSSSVWLKQLLSPESATPLATASALDAVVLTADNDIIDMQTVAVAASSATSSIAAPQLLASSAGVVKVLTLTHPGTAVLIYPGTISLSLLGEKVIVS
jgi:hypothetical protein